MNLRRKIIFDCLDKIKKGDQPARYLESIHYCLILEGVPIEYRTKEVKLLFWFKIKRKETYQELIIRLAEEYLFNTITLKSNQ